MKRGRTLAASFVVVVAGPACKKTPVVDPEPPPDMNTSYIGHQTNGDCTLSPVVHCPRGATCNPPAPEPIDCPPGHRPNTPPPITRRPPGKEDWLRVKPHLNTFGGEWLCSYTAERFCAPSPKPYECTPYPEPVPVKCTKTKNDAGQMSAKTESFVWKDILGTCHEVPPVTCESWDCPVPDGNVVPCP